MLWFCGFVLVLYDVLLYFHLRFLIGTAVGRWNIISLFIQDHLALVDVIGAHQSLDLFQVFFIRMS